MGKLLLTNKLSRKSLSPPLKFEILMWPSISVRTFQTFEEEYPPLSQTYPVSDVDLLRGQVVHVGHVALRVAVRPFVLHHPEEEGERKRE